jgi:hypothetical protein
MLVSSMHQQFKIGVDKTDTLNSANFQPEEIDLYLSDAQEEFIEQRAYGNNFKREGLEETQKRVKDLQDITVNGNLNTFINNANNKPNGTFVALPDGVTIRDNLGNLLPEYRHAIQEDVTITFVDCNNVVQTIIIPVLACTHDRYNRIVTSPFSKPNLNKVYRLPYQRINGIEYFELILGAGQTLVTYHLRYLLNPRKIDLAQILVPPGLPANAQGDMTDTAYREIIRISVRNAYGDIQAAQVQESIERLKEIE